MLLVECERSSGWQMFKSSITEQKKKEIPSESYGLADSPFQPVRALQPQKQHALTMLKTIGSSVCPQKSSRIRLKAVAVAYAQWSKHWVQCGHDINLWTLAQACPNLQSIGIHWDPLGSTGIPDWKCKSSVRQRRH